MFTLARRRGLRTVPALHDLRRRPAELPLRSEDGEARRLWLLRWQGELAAAHVQRRAERGGVSPGLRAHHLRGCGVRRRLTTRVNRASARPRSVAPSDCAASARSRNRRTGPCRARTGRAPWRLSAAPSAQRCVGIDGGVVVVRRARLFLTLDRDARQLLRSQFFCASLRPREVHPAGAARRDRRARPCVRQDIEPDKASPLRGTSRRHHGG